MSRYGEALEGKALLAEFKAEKEGIYEFKLYPQLWHSKDLATFYAEKKWTICEFKTPPPELPTTSGIYMFVVGPYCARLKDHSYIFYVGKTNNIKKRYSQYLDEKEGKGTNPRKEIMLLLNNFEGFLYFHFAEVAESELTKAEDLLKDSITPVSNTQLGIIGKLTTT